MTNKRGVAALMMVFLASMLAVFVTSAWQAQFLYSLRRGKAMSEVLTIGYQAESKLYDIIARFLGGYPNAFAFPYNPPDENLADGTRLTTVGTEVGDTQTLTVTAKRQFATTKVELKKVTKVEPKKSAKPTEIVLSLDCTTSMQTKACNFCSTTRMGEQKKAVYAFLDLVNQKNIELGEERIKVGISVFAKRASWLKNEYDGTGIDITPNSGLSTEQMKVAVNKHMNESFRVNELVPRGAACDSVEDTTSIGSGLVFMHKYFENVTDPKISKIELLISDGEPNMRILYPACPISYSCGGLCEERARDFLSCTLATTEQTWDPEVTGVPPNPLGVRDPKVEAYMVTVLDPPNTEVRDIAQSFIGDKYRQNTDATALTDILKGIFEEISKTVVTYTFGKVTPTTHP